MTEKTSNQPSQCAPVRYADYLASGTCLSPKELIIVAKKFNEAKGPNPTQQRIPVSTIRRGMSDPAALHAALVRCIGTSDETKWLKRPWMSGDMTKLLATAFRPEMPRAWLANSRAWLSTDDIENVMRQYESAYPNFAFLGTFPIDFDTRTLFGGCIADEMCNLSVRKLTASKKTQFGAVLNLDKHDQRGSHWVTVYGNSSTDSPNYGVHYFDSVGKKAPPEVDRFQARVAEQIAALSGVPLARVPVTTRVEKRQYKNTECGVFAMYFLVCCMTEKMRIPDIVRAMGNDDLIHELRRIFFRAPG